MSTQLEHIVIPEVFNPYVIQRTAELSALVQSGIIVPNAELDKLALAGGRTINMPFWDDLTGADEVLSDNPAAPLTPGRIEAETDVAVLNVRGRAWGSMDLSKAFSGDDPLGAIGELVAAYWARRQQVMLLSILEGVFGAASMSGNVHDITEEEGEDAVIGAESTIDALQALGDAKDKLTAVAMHSATQAVLAKQNLIDFAPDSEGRATIPTYLGKRVIVDDGLPVSEGEYVTYLFGQGAIGYGEGAAPVPTEVDRNALAGQDLLINRRHFILHPRGVAWQDVVCTGAGPTNTELEDATNWVRVYENKNIRIVRFVHLNEVAD